MSEHPAAERSETLLRLEGEVEGLSISHDLEDGEYSVGAEPGNDLVIPSVGVSRRHATLKVCRGAVVVADLGSKNGTWLNGERVERAEVHEGDVLYFGRVPLRMRRVERVDVDLAVAVKLPAPDSGQPPEGREGDTGTSDASDESAEWVALVDDVARSVIDADDHHPRDALARLRESLNARGVALLEWDGRNEPVTLSQVGEVAVDSLAPAAATFAGAAEAHQKQAHLTCGRSRKEPFLAWAVAVRPGASPRGLVVTGQLPFGEPVPTVLKVALRLLLHLFAPTAAQRNEHEPASAPELVFPEGYVTGVSRAMVELHEQLRSLVRGDLPVLIVGETGVGKEHIARILHASSPRRQGPFVAVNCAAIPSELLEAELFGIERGVATGVDARPGKLRLAEGGVLLLDEIGDMSNDLQAKLLRALQEMEVHPLGARVPVPIDVRLVAATNTHLERRMQEGRFRRDLYYRVAGVSLRVPPLRERREDIPILVECFLKTYAEEIDKPIRGITVKALQALTEAPWPGNVRELRHEVRRLVYLCPAGNAIEHSMLSESLFLPQAQLEPHLTSLDASFSLELRVAELERRLITVALARCQGNRTKAAKLLGVSRNGLALKMERLGVAERTP